MTSIISFFEERCRTCSARDVAGDIAEALKVAAWQPDYSGDRAYLLAVSRILDGLANTPNAFLGDIERFVDTGEPTGLKV